MRPNVGRAVPWQCQKIMKPEAHKQQTRTAAGETAAEIETTPQQGGCNIVFIYIDLSPPGLTWETLEAAIPGNLDHKVRIIRTPRAHGLIVFRSSLQKEGYERLASLDGIEVMVRFTATTLWGHRLLKHSLIRASQPQDLPVLLHEEELFLELSLRRMARAANLTTP